MRYWKNINRDAQSGGKMKGGLRGRKVKTC